MSFIILTNRKSIGPNIHAPTNHMDQVLCIAETTNLPTAVRSYTVSNKMKLWVQLIALIYYAT